MGILQINSQSWPIGNINLKNAFRINLRCFPLKLIAEDVSVTSFIGTHGGQITKFGPKMTPKFGIIQINSQLWRIYDT